MSGNQYFCAVGLDRFLRVWRVGAGGRKPVNKIYLKSRLNCVAMCQHFDPERKLEEEDEVKEEEVAGGAKTRKDVFKYVQLVTKSKRRRRR